MEKYLENLEVSFIIEEGTPNPLLCPSCVASWGALLIILIILIMLIVS